MVRLVTSVAVTMMIIAGCGMSLPAPSTFPLPAEQVPSTLCGGVGGGFTVLRGDPIDARLVWEEARDGSGHQNLVWPPGYRARFVPKLEVLDPAGRVIARDGDLVPAGGCAVGPADNPAEVILVQPQDWHL